MTTTRVHTATVTEPRRHVRLTLDGCTLRSDDFALDSLGHATHSVHDEITLATPELAAERYRVLCDVLHAV